MQAIPQSHLVNPGTIPDARLHIGLPLISGLRLGGGSSPLTYNQFRNAERTNAYNFNFATLFQELNTGKNRFFSEADLRLLSLGIRFGKSYLHFDAGERLFASMGYPRTLLAMFDDIQNLRLTNQRTSYDLRQLQFNGSHYRSFSMGFTQQFNPRFSAGIRVHYLQGIANVWAENPGIILEFPGDGNRLLVDGRMNVLSAGLRRYSDYFDNLLRGSGNAGFSLEGGAAFQANDRLRLSFSILNLGVIQWKENINYQVLAAPLGFSATDIDDHLNRWVELGDSLVNSSPPTDNVRYQTPLPAQINIGGTYQVGTATSVGLVFNATRWNYRTDLGIALSSNTRIGKILHLSAALAYNQYQPINLGTAFSLHLGPVQLYALTDNLFGLIDYKDNRHAQAQLGINLNFGKIADPESAPQEVLQVRQDSLALPTPPPTIDEALPSPYTLNPEEENLQPDLRPLEFPTEERAAPATRPTSSYFIFRGIAKSQDEKTPLQGIAAEAYRIDSAGEKALAYTASFFNGRVELTLERGYTYQIVFRKPGFQPLEYYLEAGRTARNSPIAEELLMQKTTLAKRPAAPTAPPVPATSSSIQKEKAEAAGQVDSTEDSQSPPPEKTAGIGAAPRLPMSPLSYTGQTKEKEETTNSQEKPDGEEPAFGFYYLLDRTSLRRGPTHTTEVILRFDIGDRVEVLEKNNSWWWKVRYRGRTGYVKAHLLEQNY